MTPHRPSAPVPSRLSRRRLDNWYRRYHRRELIATDPLSAVYGYSSPGDQEVVGLIAACLAYGRVVQIQRSIAEVLSRLGPPRETVLGASARELKARLRGFKHRFTPAEDMAALLFGAGELIRRHGSLGDAFARHAAPNHDTALPALTAFTEALRDAAEERCPSLLPAPSRGSACKRLNLYLRWMVREDDVDLGLWRGIEARQLVVPLDTHMHRFALAHGLTARRSADLRTALEITRGFKAFRPDDPVRYDFALTRRAMLGNGDKT